MANFQGNGVVDENRGWQIKLTIGILFPLMVVSTGLRLYTRIKPDWRIGVDDLFMALAAALSSVAVATELLAVHYGLGRHAHFLSASQLSGARKWSALAELLTSIDTGFIKASICFFLLRLIRDTNRIFTYSIWALLVLIFLSTLATNMSWGLQVSPIAGLWDHSIHATSHVPGYVLVDVSYVSNSVAAFTDIFCAASPIYFLWNVQITRSRKVSLWVLIGLGSLASIAAIMRLVYLNELAEVEDFTWALVRVFTASSCERLGGGFVANLPALKRLFAKIVNLTSRDASHGTATAAHTRDGFDLLCDPADTNHHLSATATDAPSDVDILLRDLHGSPATAKHAAHEVRAVAVRTPPGGLGVPQGWKDPTADAGRGSSKGSGAGS